MKLHNIQQGTDEWLQLRLGKLTASSAQAIATQGKGLETLIFEKVAEIITGKAKERYTNADMDRGNELEAMARNSYELETGDQVKEIGFVELDEYTGCSPDGLVGDAGLMEIKCKNDANFVRHLYETPVKIDPAHILQMQMQMLITGRKWCDYIVFNENFPKPITINRIIKNDIHIAKLTAGIAQGKANIKNILDKIK